MKEQAIVKSALWIPSSPLMIPFSQDSQSRLSDLDIDSYSMTLLMNVEYPYPIVHCFDLTNVTYRLPYQSSLLSFPTGGSPTSIPLSLYFCAI